MAEGTEAGTRAGAPVTPPGTRPAVGFTCLGLSTLTLGALWPLTRAGVQAMPALWFGCIRIALASAVMFALVIVLGRFRLPSRQDLPVILSVGVFMMGIYVILSHIALQYVGAGRATLLGFTTPLWVTPVAVLLLRERVNAYKLAGIAIGLAGLAVLFNPLGMDWSDGKVVMGNGLMVLAAISWAVCIIQMRTQVYRLEPLQLVPWQLAVSALCLLIAAAIGEPGARIVPSERNIWLIVIAGPLGTSIALWTVTMTLRHLPAVTSSVGLLGVPVAATLIAWAFLGEPLTWALAIGLMVILGGMALVAVGGRRER